MFNKMKITIEVEVPDCYNTNDITWAFLKAFEHCSDLDILYETDIKVEQVRREVT